MDRAVSLAPDDLEIRVMRAVKVLGIENLEADDLRWPAGSDVGTGSFD
jgi:hypothetical protein